MLKLWFIANTLLWPFNVELFGFKLGLNVAVLMLVGGGWFLTRQRVNIFTVKVLFPLCFFMLISYLIAKIGPCTDKFLKFEITAPILLFLVFLGLEIGWQARDNDWLKLQKIAPWILLVAFAGFIVEMLYPVGFPYQVGYRSEGKFSGLFSEPSAVAFSLFPCLAVLLVAESEQLRRKGMLALLLLVIFSRSSTLVTLAVFWFLFYKLIFRMIGQSLRSIIGLIIVVELVIIVDYSLFFAPTVDRLKGVLGGGYETTNISSMVYLQGWQDALANFQRTNGLGLGFNMMGCNPLPDTTARYILDKSFSIELNSEDGSVIFGKLISETGIAGILFYITIALWWMRLEKEIHKTSGEIRIFVVRIQSALMFSFVASSVVRSSGYFSGGLLLIVVAIAGSVKWRREHIVRLTKAKCEGKL